MFAFVDSVKGGTTKLEAECLEELGEASRLEKVIRKAIDADKKLPSLEDVQKKHGWRSEIPGDPNRLK